MAAACVSLTGSDQSGGQISAGSGCGDLLGGQCGLGCLDAAQKTLQPRGPRHNDNQSLSQSPEAMSRIRRVVRQGGEGSAHYSAAQFRECMSTVVSGF